MRWRLIDRITAFEEWRTASGVKTVSLEEYSLLEPFGRRGDFPYTLIVEAGIELARLLVEKSTGFRTTATIHGIEHFEFHAVVDRGAVLNATVEIQQRRDGQGTFRCVVEERNSLVAEGVIALQWSPLREFADPVLTAGAWEELRGGS